MECEFQGAGIKWTALSDFQLLKGQGQAFLTAGRPSPAQHLVKLGELC